MADYRRVGDRRVKHLEMIQGVIGRLGSDSFYVKGWAVTLTGAFLGFAINLDDRGLALIAILPAALLWFLDAYFLRSERLFRGLYELVRKGAGQVEPFYMGATKSTFVNSVLKPAGEEAPSQLRVAVSLTLLLFYGALLAAAGLVFVAA